MNPNPSSPNPINPFAGIEVKASGAEPLPVGPYVAVFRSLEPFSNDRVSNKLRFVWEVATGNHKGKTASALCDPNLTPNSHAGRLIGGLVGRPLQPGEDVAALWTAVQAAVGRRFMVTVQSGPKNGKPSVQMVSLPPED
ncbi:MAG: hypothetical protein LC104_20270 [Bacteroidales bacterium]|nr:hypothetical protein [Bacteroidales bacterium]